MALDNPAFSRNSAFSQQGAGAAAQDVSAQQLQEMYNQPATLPDREVMTVENTVAKTAGAFAVLVVFAAVGWLVTPAMPWLFWGASIIGFVELTRAGQLMVNVTFQPLIVYPIVAVLYFALCWPMSLWSLRLERKLDAALGIKRSA